MRTPLLATKEAVPAWTPPSCASAAPARRSSAWRTPTSSAAATCSSPSAATPEYRAGIETQQLYAAIPAVESGAVVTAEENSFVTASSVINPLTVPWILDRYVPLIHEAAENVDG